MGRYEPRVANDVLDLANAIEDPQRTLAIVIVSARHRAERPYGLSPKRLSAAVGDRAQVWLLPSVEHNDQFSEMWPPEMRGDRATYGGAIRVIGTAGWTAVIRTDIRTEDEVLERIARGLAEQDAPPAARTPFRFAGCTLITTAARAAR